MDWHELTSYIIDQASNKNEEFDSTQLYNSHFFYASESVMKYHDILVSVLIYILFRDHILLHLVILLLVYQKIHGNYNYFLILLKIIIIKVKYI